MRFCPMLDSAGGITISTHQALQSIEAGSALGCYLDQTQSQKHCAIVLQRNH